MITKLNCEELIIGFIFALAFTPVIGWWSLALAPITSFLWALTGSESKWNSKLWRRLLVPFLACLAVYLVKGNWQIWVSLPFAFGILSMGYGIPTIAPGRADHDEGSWLGKFWYRIKPEWANWLTRGTIYSLLFTSFLIGILWK